MSRKSMKHRKVADVEYDCATLGIVGRENKEYYDLLVGIVIQASKSYEYALKHPKSKHTLFPGENSENIKDELERFFKKWPFWDYLGLEGINVMNDIRKRVYEEMRRKRSRC